MEEKAGILIPLDGSSASASAMGAAQSLARIMDAVLHIVHITSEPRSEHELMRDLFIGKLEATDYVLHQEPGEVVDVVLSLSARHNMKMIVMSTHGETFDAGALIGHICMGIIQRSSLPVMLIRPDIDKLPDSGWHPHKALIPLNGSPSAAAAMDRTLELAELMNCEIDVIHIATLGEKRPREEGSLATPMYLDYPYHEWSAWADEFMARFARETPKVQLRLLHMEGLPAEQMLNLAEEGNEDMIMLGWQGRLEKDRAKVIKHLLRQTQVPIVLIRIG